MKVPEGLKWMTHGNDSPSDRPWEIDYQFSDETDRQFYSSKLEPG